MIVSMGTLLVLAQEIGIIPEGEDRAVNSHVTSPPTCIALQQILYNYESTNKIKARSQEQKISGKFL
jgi:hypothetical protein